MGAEEKQNELAYQVTDAYYKLILEKIARSCFGTKPVERKVFETDRGLRGTGIEISFRFTGGESTPGGDIYRYQSRGNSSRIALLHLKQLMNIQPGDTLAILDTITASQVPPYSVSTVETLYAQSIEILPSIRMIDLKQKQLIKSMR